MDTFNLLGLCRGLCLSGDLWSCFGNYIEMNSIRFCAAALAASLAAFSTGSAHAQTFDMSYTGADGGGDYTTGASGSGSFTLDGLGNVTAFTFTLDQYYNNVGTPETDVFTYGLADLSTAPGSSFAATTSGDTVTSLSFLTDQQPGYWTPSSQFQVSDLLSGDAKSFDFDAGNLTVGTLVVSADNTPIPEPASMLVLATGLLGLAAARRKA
jgi:hypothetical protein